LSYFNSRTCNTDNFIYFLKAKIWSYYVLLDHYRNGRYRQDKFNQYSNTLRSESKMLNNFSKTFGKPDQTYVVFGDYQSNHTMAGKEPHISKRLRRLLKLAGYEVFLIDEFRTSKLCYKCEGENETFLKKSDQMKPKKREPTDMPKEKPKILELMDVPKMGHKKPKLFGMPKNEPKKQKPLEAPKDEPKNPEPVEMASGRESKVWNVQTEINVCFTNIYQTDKNDCCPKDSNHFFGAC
jgi:hypothetical protein